MKFVKIFSLCLFFYIFIITKSVKLNLKTNKTLNNIIDIKDTTISEKSSIPNSIDNVINAKSTNIVSPSENTRFKETDMLESKLKKLI